MYGMHWSKGKYIIQPYWYIWQLIESNGYFQSLYINIQCRYAMCTPHMWQCQLHIQVGRIRDTTISTTKTIRLWINYDIPLTMPQYQNDYILISITHSFLKQITTCSRYYIKYIQNLYSMSSIPIWITWDYHYTDLSNHLDMVRHLFVNPHKMAIHLIILSGQRHHFYSQWSAFTGDVTIYGIRTQTYVVKNRLRCTTQFISNRTSATSFSFIVTY